MPTKYFDTVPVNEVIRLNSSHSPNSNLESIDKRNSVHANHRRRILVVDDEHVIADTLVTILNESGFSASVAYNGESALKLIEANRPDLIITDVSMPGMDGIQLAIKVRTQYPQCKILLFSGHAASSGLVEEARQQGHEFTLLSKPVHPRDLLEHLRGAA